jgi:hypothetical protein
MRTENHSYNIVASGPKSVEDGKLDGTVLNLQLFNDDL